MARLALRVSQNLRNKPLIVICIFLAWCGLLVVSIKLGIADYYSSKFGYDLIPTAKPDPNLGWYVAILPQLIQVAFGSWALQEKDRRTFSVVLGVTVAAFLIDLYTDVLYKGTVPGARWTIWPLATAESLALFTLGSEFMFVAALQNLWEYLPDVIGLIVVAWLWLADKVSNFQSKDDDESPATTHATYRRSAFGHQTQSRNLTGGVEEQDV